MLNEIETRKKLLWIRIIVALVCVILAVVAIILRNRPTTSDASFFQTVKNQMDKAAENPVTPIPNR